MIKCRKQGNLTQLESFLWGIHRNAHQSLQEFPWSYSAAGFKNNMGKPAGVSINFQEVLLFRRHYPDATLSFLVPSTVTDGGG